MKWFIDNLINMLTKPEYFFANLPKGQWSDEPLTFTLITGWIMAGALTVVVFINSYVPTGLSLIEGIYGRKLIIAVPVLAVMGLVFFIMTLLILAGIVILAIIGLFFVGGMAYNFLLILLGGSGNHYEVIKASFFASGVMLAGLINIGLMICVKYNILSFIVWIRIEKIVFYAVCIVLFFLFSIFGAVIHKIPKWKAALAATAPFVILVMLNIIISSKILPKLAGFLS